MPAHCGFCSVGRFDICGSSNCFGGTRAEQGRARASHRSTGNRKCAAVGKRRGRILDRGRVEMHSNDHSAERNEPVPGDSPDRGSVERRTWITAVISSTPYSRVCHSKTVPTAFARPLFPLFYSCTALCLHSTFLPCGFLGGCRADVGAQGHCRSTARESFLSVVAKPFVNSGGAFRSAEEFLHR